MRTKSFFFRVVLHRLWPTLLVSSLGIAEGGEVVAPHNLLPRTSHEFFSTNPKERVLIPVSIWGQVKEPGLHFVPAGSSVLQSISLAGGPTLDANLPDIRLVKVNGSEEEIDVFKIGGSRKVSANDTLHVDYDSFRVNMPVILGIGSLSVSIVTLVILLTRN